MKKITLSETTGGSFKCVLPKYMVEELGWKDKNVLEVTRLGKKIIIKKEE